MKKRLERLILTLLSKKILAWIVGCVFCWYAKISGTDWCLLTAAIFTLDLATKIKAPLTSEVANERPE